MYWSHSKGNISQVISRGEWWVLPYVCVTHLTTSLFVFISPACFLTLLSFQSLPHYQLITFTWLILPFSPATHPLISHLPFKAFTVCCSLSDCLVSLPSYPAVSHKALFYILHFTLCSDCLSFDHILTDIWICLINYVWRMSNILAIIVDRFWWSRSITLCLWWAFTYRYGVDFIEDHKLTNNWKYKYSVMGFIKPNLDGTLDPLSLSEQINGGWKVHYPRRIHALFCHIFSRYCHQLFALLFNWHSVISHLRCTCSFTHSVAPV